VGSAICSKFELNSPNSEGNPQRIPWACYDEAKYKESRTKSLGEMHQARSLERGEVKVEWPRRHGYRHLYLGT